MEVLLCLCAKELSDDLLCALSPLLPRTVYQDVRRVRTLAWAITGLCLLQSVQLSAWAQVAKTRTQNAARRVRRFSRWLHHPAIIPTEWYRPVIQAALSGWPVDQRLSVALDTTALLPFVLIRASLISRGRAIPLAWRVLRHRSTRGSALKPTCPCSSRCMHSCLPVSLSLYEALRGGCRMSGCFIPSRSLGGMDLLRRPRDTLVHLKAQPVTAIRDACPPAGERRFLRASYRFEELLLGRSILLWPASSSDRTTPGS